MLVTSKKLRIMKNEWLKKYNLQLSDFLQTEGEGGQKKRKPQSPYEEAMEMVQLLEAALWGFSPSKKAEELQLSLPEHLTELRKVWELLPSELQPPQNLTIQVVHESPKKGKVTQLHPQLNGDYREFLQHQMVADLQERNKHKIAWGFSDQEMITLRWQLSVYPKDEVRKVIAHEAAELIANASTYFLPETYLPAEISFIKESLLSAFPAKVAAKLDISHTRIRRKKFTSTVEVQRTYNSNTYYPVFELHHAALAPGIHALGEVFPVLFEYVCNALGKVPTSELVLIPDHIETMRAVAGESRENVSLINLAANYLALLPYAELLMVFKAGNMPEARERMRQLLDGADEDIQAFLPEGVELNLQSLLNTQIPEEYLQMMVRYINPDAKTAQNLSTPDRLLLLFWVASLFDELTIKAENTAFMNNEAEKGSTDDRLLGWS